MTGSAIAYPIVIVVFIEVENSEAIVMPLDVILVLIFSGTVAVNEVEKADIYLYGYCVPKVMPPHMM